MRGPDDEPRDEREGGRAAERRREFLEQRFGPSELEHSGESSDEAETEDGEPDDPSSAGADTRD
ncbi:MAG TPA: hypothetical protein VGR06_11090 [Actinophytocola sp.]|jgi:hypothetical protein|uniref:hypothetical protein n=1 Tax=Actinophytocola sp. TaxID=1872138 RepID=UPI002DF7E174|nr:hypothetical protein [Actinophytocola sp.]